MNKKPSAEVQIKIPVAAVIALEWELANLEHGVASLTLHVRDGRIARFVTTRERSYMAEQAYG